MLNNKNILITGGTGSFGQAFVKYLLSKYPKIKKLIIFSQEMNSSSMKWLVNSVLINIKIYVFF